MSIKTIQNVYNFFTNKREETSGQSRGEKIETLDNNQQINDTNLLHFFGFIT